MRIESTIVDADQLDAAMSTAAGKQPARLTAEAVDVSVDSDGVVHHPRYRVVSVFSDAPVPGSTPPSGEPTPA